MYYMPYPEALSKPLRIYETTEYARNVLRDPGLDTNASISFRMHCRRGGLS
jgi:hypothetical protein